MYKMSYLFLTDYTVPLHECYYYISFIGLFIKDTDSILLSQYACNVTDVQLLHLVVNTEQMKKKAAFFMHLLNRFAKATDAQDCQ